MVQALDTFNTAVVSSTYYVFFTTCTITASMIMYKDWEGQAAGTITVQVAGFMVLMVGVYLLTVTRDAEPGCAAGMRVVAVPDPAMDRARYAEADVVVGSLLDVTRDVLGLGR